MMTQRLVRAARGLGFVVFAGPGFLCPNGFAAARYHSPFAPPCGPSTDVAGYVAANRPQVRAMRVVVACSGGMLADSAPGRALGAGTLAAGCRLLTALLLRVLRQPAAAAAPELARGGRARPLEEAGTRGPSDGTPRRKDGEDR